MKPQNLALCGFCVFGGAGAVRLPFRYASLYIYLV